MSIASRRPAYSLIWPALLLAASAGPALAQTTILCSVVAGGGPGNNFSFFSSVSDDGNLVAFQSAATNFVGDDTNSATDVFVFNRTTGVVSRVSVSQSGVQANAPSQSPRLSGDGRYVVFESSATNLIDGDTTANTQIFRKDLGSGAVELVSGRAQDGRWGSGFCFIGGISPDGRWVSFTSQAEDLVSDDTNNRLDVFRRDMSVPATAPGAMIRVSLGDTGQQGLSTSFSSSISASGDRVAFVSASGNLVPGDTNAVADVFVREVSTGTTTLVSQNELGEISNGPSAGAWISGNGRRVAFHSQATNLGAATTFFQRHVYLRDIDFEQTFAVTSGGTGDSTDPSISADGREIAFWSVRDDLVPGIPPETAAVYVATDTGKVFEYELISQNASGEVGPNSVFPAISGNGRFVSYESDATNLVAGDTNNNTDIFLRDRDGGAPQCFVDFNADGFLNQEDLGGYLTAFLAEPAQPGPSGTNAAPCPGQPAPYDVDGYAADFNRDCNFDQEDLGGYITEFFNESENPVNCVPG